LPAASACGLRLGETAGDGSDSERGCGTRRGPPVRRTPPAPMAG